MKILAIIAIVFSFSINLNAQTKEDVEKDFRNGDIVEASKKVEVAAQSNKDDHNFLILCGDIFEELDDLDKALVYYKMAKKANSRDMNVMLRLGKTLYKLGQKEEAMEYFEDAIDDFDDNIEPYLELAYAYMEDMNIGEARKNINKAKEIDDADVRIYLALGDMYYKNGIYELSIDNYKQALLIDDENLEVRKNLATSYYWSANRETKNQDLANELFTQSLKEWNTLTQKDPKNADGWFGKGKILFLSKKYPNAANALYHYVKLRPNGKLGRWMYAQSLYESNACDSAAPELDWVSKNIDSVSTKASFMLARCYHKNEQYEKAINEFENIRKNKELTLRDVRILASCYLKTGDTTSWIKNYDIAIEREPEQFCKVMKLIGQIHLKNKNYLEAVKYFKNKLSYPKCVEDDEGKTNYFVGLSYLFGEELDSAKIYFNNAIKIDPNDLSSKIYIADLYAKSEEIDSSITKFKEVIQFASKDPKQFDRDLKTAFSKLCGMLLKEKKLTDLINFGKQWAEIQPKFDAGYLYTAIGYQSKAAANNDESLSAEACKWYKKTLKVNPKNNNAKKYLESLGC